MQTTELLARLKKVRKAPSGYQACCPAHEDHDPSLSISEVNHKILLHCHGGCSVEAIIESLGLQMQDLFCDDPKPATRRQVAEYKYTDEKNNYLFSVVRYEPKSFLQRTALGFGLNGARRVLYRLPRIAQAVAEEETIFICEGEKDVDNLETLGLYATTNSGGAGKWRPEYSDSLTWARCCIIPDNDQPGRDHAEQVARSLHGKAKEIKVIALPGLPEKGDVSDWLKNGGTKEALLDLAEKTAPWKPLKDENRIWTIAELSPRRFFETEPAPFEFIIPDFLPRGIVGFIYGAGGAYKSLAALWLIIQRAIYEYDNSQKWLDRFPLDAPGKSIFFSAEDVEIDLHHRVRNIVSRIHEDRPDVPLEAFQRAVSENCLICSREQWKRDGELFIVDSDGAPTLKVNPIISIIRDFGADLAVFETYSRIAPVEEIDNRTAARVVGVFEEIRDQTGATLPCVAHSSKATRGGRTDTHDQNALRGAGALSDNARWGLSFRSIPRGDNAHDLIEITHAKAFRCKRTDSFTVEADYPGFKMVEKDALKPDVFDLVVEHVKNNPGAKQRQTAKAIKKGTNVVNKAFKDAENEEIIESRGKHEGFFYVGQ